MGMRLSLIAWFLLLSLCIVIYVTEAMAHIRARTHISSCHVSHFHGKQRANCSSRNLIHIPIDLPSNIVQLDLGNNHINTLSGLSRYISLETLILSTNIIKQFHKDNFLGLHNLTHLDIHGNQLQLTNTSYPVGLFRHQRKLTILLMNSNSEVSGDSLVYPDVTLSDLSDLQYLSIDGIRNPMFGKGFEKLIKMGRLDIGGNCDIRNLRNDTFKYLTTVRYLSMVSCVVANIEAASLNPLRNIHTLDISGNNDLGLSKFGLGTYGLVNSTIRILRANNLNKQHGLGIYVRAKDVQYLGQTRLEELYFDGNRIELVEANALSKLPHSLKKLSARDNRFMFGMYLLSSSTLVNLEWADFSGQSHSYASPFQISHQMSTSGHEPVSLSKPLRMSEHRLRTTPNPILPGILAEVTVMRKPSLTTDNEGVNSVLRSDSCEENSQPSIEEYIGNMHSVTDHPWPGNFTIYISPTVTFANMSYSKLTYSIPRIQFGPNKVKNIDLSYNFFTKWYGPVYGLDMVEVLNLSNNLCDYISENLVYHLPKIKFLDINTNYLGYSLTNRTFRNQKYLEHFDISNNKINELPPGFLRGSNSLEDINLASNLLTTWTININHMTNLTLLNLSNNLFEMLPVNLISQIERNSGLRIDLIGNPLKCTCDNLKSLTWIERNAERMTRFTNLSCKYNNERWEFNNLKDIILELDKSCASYVGVMIGVLALMLLVLAVGTTGVVYRYRWKLRYLYYIALNRHRGYIPQQQEEQHFDFDAFLSYADEDRSFVTRDMRLVLEEPEEQGERFRLCIHHRDFLAGEDIAANILKAISSSRKTVVILTRNFLRSYWCRYEVEMAKMESIYTGRNTLVIIVMEDIPVKDLPADIVEVMGRDCYVEFTNDAEGREVFWRNLKRAISDGTS